MFSDYDGMGTTVYNCKYDSILWSYIVLGNYDRVDEMKATAPRCKTSKKRCVLDMKRLKNGTDTVHRYSPKTTWNGAVSVPAKLHLQIWVSGLRRKPVKSGIRLWPFSARIQPFYSRFMPYTAPETALGIIDLGKDDYVSCANKWEIHNYPS